MGDYIKNNSNRCKKIKQTVFRSYAEFQSYNAINFGQTYKACSPISCNIQKQCGKNQYQFQKYVSNQQNLYALMRRKPEIFPIISWVKEMNLTPSEQRQYSNLWYRQFGTSQALPANDNWGGFFLPGTETPWTD